MYIFTFPLLVFYIMSNAKVMETLSIPNVKVIFVYGNCGKNGSEGCQRRIFLRVERDVQPSFQIMIVLLNFRTKLCASLFVTLFFAQAALTGFQPNRLFFFIFFIEIPNFCLDYSFRFPIQRDSLFFCLGRLFRFST